MDAKFELKLEAEENWFRLRLSAYCQRKMSRSGSNESDEQISNDSKAKCSARTNSEKPFSWVDFNIPTSTALNLTLRICATEGASSSISEFSSLQQQQVTFLLQ